MIVSFSSLPAFRYFLEVYGIISKVTVSLAVGVWNLPDLAITGASVRLKVSELRSPPPRNGEIAAPMLSMIGTSVTL